MQQGVALSLHLLMFVAYQMSLTKEHMFQDKADSHLGVGIARIRSPNVLAKVLGFYQDCFGVDKPVKIA
jgi:hypothetical protein